MVKFIRIGTADGLEVYVNPEQIASVQEYMDDDGLMTKIILSNGLTYVVNHGASDIIEVLRIKIDES